jgi:LPXTG-motif cell wall-anchored protein
VAFALEKGSDTPPTQTGDDSNVALWIGLMTFSVVALGAVLMLSRRKVSA